jgi:hypothetical protein
VTWKVDRDRVRYLHLRRPLPPLPLLRGILEHIPAVGAEHEGGSRGNSAERPEWVVHVEGISFAEGRYVYEYDVYEWEDIYVVMGAGLHSRMFELAGVGSFRSTMSGRTRHLDSVRRSACPPIAPGGGGDGMRSSPKGREPGFE